MLDELLPYYERELSQLRQLSAEFAGRYPKIARRLQIDGEQSEDPHVERLIEAFAFLAARIHRKLDDDYPEITEAFLHVLYPHYTQPFPATTIVQFEVDRSKPGITGRYAIPRHHPVLSPPVRGVPCRFRTAYPVDLWPLAPSAARIDLAQASEHLRRSSPGSAAALTLELETLGGVSVDTLGLDRLRVFLDGEAPLMHLLYEHLFAHLRAIRVSDGSDSGSPDVLLGPESLRAIGFAEDEGLIDYDARSFLGYRLLTEYFACPDKFLFFEVCGLEQATRGFSGGKLRLQFLFDRFGTSERHARLQQTIAPSNFKLGCTPVVNLFRQAAEPIRLSHHRASYPVIPDSRKAGAFEVIRIDRVMRAERTGDEESASEIPHFYGSSSDSRHAHPPFYWHAGRERAIGEQDRGTDVEIHLTDLDFNPVRPDAEVLSLELTCSNRDLPDELPFGGNLSAGGGVGRAQDFTLPGHSAVSRVRPLRKPSPTRRAPNKRGLQWRLVSHLTLNHRSIAGHGKAALQEMLSLYNVTDSQAIARQIEGIVAIDSRPATARIRGPLSTGFVRGTDIDLTLDETHFVGAGLYLFAAVLERFFALYATPNSFTRLRLMTRQQEGIVAQWPPRAGEAHVI